jgi:acetylornithine deacetylase/succinyl-diaminopimelate desuccinylase-like protein
MSYLNYIEQNEKRFTDELFELLRIPSISAVSSHKGDVKKAAEFLHDDFIRIGLEHVTLFETPGNPVVYGDFLHAGPDKPTVLIYGHYDVQPPEPLDLWETPPFEPTVRGNDVYARGASDDKGQAFTHVKAIEAWLKTVGTLPINIKIIIEGEEEIGSANLVPFLKQHKEKLACDMVLISDTSMFDQDVPSITYGLRGLTYMQIFIQGTNRDLHSGTYGGAVQNPLNALCEIIAGLKDKDGVIQIPGFYDDALDLTPEEREAAAKLPFNEEAFKHALGITEVFGEKGYTTIERKSARPTLDVNGIWGGYQGEGAKTVLPAKAGAKVSMRLVPNQDPDKIAKLFADFVHQIAPKGVRVTVEEHHGGHAAMTDLGFYGLKAAAQAFKAVYGKEPLFTREGGSIPIVADFKKVLGVNSILMGFGLNSDAIHAPNEKFSLKDYYRGIKTSASFFEILANTPQHE